MSTAHEPGDTVAAVMRYYEEVWEGGELDVLYELLRRDFTGHDPVAGEFDVYGLRALVVQYRRAFPDYRLYVDGTIVTGDWVAARWHSTGTFTGELAGLAPNRRIVAN